jgi:hypothetical protein
MRAKEAAVLELTDEQRQQLENRRAVAVSDPKTVRSYVILRQEVYERVRRLLDDGADWTDDDLRLLLARSSVANGWEEPGMDAYDRYDEERAKRRP